jgi:hypothetical protein
MKRRSLPLILIPVLILSTLGCSLASRLANPSEPSGGSTSAPNSYDEWQKNQLTYGLDTLNSYKAQMTLKFTGQDDQNQPGTVLIDYLYVIDTANHARHIYSKIDTGSGSNPMGSDQYDIGADTYMPGEFAGEKSCDKTPNPANSSGVTSSVMSVISQIKRGELVAKGETVNGVATDHYQVSEVKFDAGEVESQEGEVWVARDGGYVVRTTGKAKGKLSLDRSLTGEAEWDYELTRIDQAVVTLDPVCTGLDFSEVPLPDGATVERTTTEFLYLSAPGTTQQTGDFFKLQLEAAGWVVDVSVSDETVVMMTASREGERLDIAINPAEPGSFVSINRTRQ